MGKTALSAVVWRNIVRRLGTEKLDPIHRKINQHRAEDERIPRGNLQRIQEGADPRLSTIAAIADALDITLADLVSDEGGAQHTPASGIAQHQPAHPVAPAPSVADAVHLLSQIATGLSPVSRRVVGNLLSNLAADPGEAAEVAKTIEALAAAGLIPSTEATEPDDEAVDTSCGTNGTQERFKVKASMEDYRHTTAEEVRRRSQKGDK